MTNETSRNEYSEDRTILANERTFASWMRSSLGCIAIGIGFQGLFPSMEPGWIPRVIATAFLLLAVLVIILAEWRATTVMERLETHCVVRARAINVRVISILVSMGSMALIAAIWFVRIS